MLNILISLLTFVLILISLFMVLVILMQRANTNSGMGSAFGGGVAESAFGTETTNILVKATKWSAVAFFIIALILYLLFMSRDGGINQSGANDLPDIPVIEEPTPVETDAAAELPAAVDEAATTTGEVVDEAATMAAEVVDEAATTAGEVVDQAEASTPVDAPAADEETTPAP